ncbi:hypothetical protein [Streptomyces sp. NPDC005805]|uniref:hypothetical protein n=1 Tax=Streptomyces sp. NPDC005805 TaxID=3157068 RepID=UPI0034031EDA
MAGADEVVDDDALYVLTAVLLTPAQFPGVLGDDYPQACAALDLEPYAEGYGLVLGQDAAGARWTVVVDDVSLVAVAIASWDCGMEYDLSPDERSMVSALPGWPVELAVAAPGVPAPHDPDPQDAGRAPLAPPDVDSWGSAQRRLGADEVALQWAQWRAETSPEDADPGEPRPGEGAEGTEASGAETVEAPGAEAAADAGADAEPATAAASDSGTAAEAHADPEPATAADPEPPTESDPPAEPRLDAEVRRALREARAYGEQAPPPGRVRSAFAPGGARTIRADGPGWSMVARTDDIAYLLLDTEPCEVIPVPRGPELESLLEVLEKVAVHPA